MTLVPTHSKGDDLLYRHLMTLPLGASRADLTYYFEVCTVLIFLNIYLLYHKLLVTLIVASCTSSTYSEHGSNISRDMALSRSNEVENIEH